MRIPQQNHFAKFDLLRGMGILLVFLTHALWYFHPAYAGLVVNGSAQVRPDRIFLLNFLPRSIGWSGVTIFILVSGWLLHLGFLKDGPRFSLRDFYSKRFWRVYPPYLLVLVAFSLFLDRGTFYSRSGWFAFLTHCLSLENLSSRTYFAINPTFWCLALEVQLYLLYPFFLYMRKSGGAKMAVAIAFLASILWQAVGMRVDRLATSLPWANSAVSLWCIWCAGAWVAEVWLSGRRVAAALNRRDWLILLVLCAAVALTPMNAQLEYLAAVIWIGAIDWFLHADRLRMDRLPARILITIGLCSFSIFLIHQPLLKVLMDPLVGLTGSRILHGLAILPVALMIFCVSWWMYKLVELPSIEMGKRLRRRRRRDKEAALQTTDAKSG